MENGQNEADRAPRQCLVYVGATKTRSSGELSQQPPRLNGGRSGRQTSDADERLRTLWRGHPHPPAEPVESWSRCFVPLPHSA
ncbi:MAG TPA: hypothetical protein VJK04_00860 [Candidatus Paceibacterota bacterium]